MGYIPKLFYYLINIILFGLMQYYMSNASNQQLLFLSKPTNEIVSLYTSSVAEYSENTGFYHPELNISIDKSCAGTDFFSIVFLMIAYLFGTYLISNKRKLISLPFTLLLAYLLTIVTNSFRIYVSVMLQLKANDYLSDRPHLLIHGVTGILMDLTFLIIIYLLMDRILRKFFNHHNYEKPITTQVVISD